MEKIRVALIGAGSMGKKYAQFIAAGKVERMELTAVVARNSETKKWAESLMNENGVKPFIYNSVDELYENPENYDAVIIVTPHKTHPEFANRAFELGKHVMCDKPAGITAARAVQMAENAEKAGLIYSVMFHQRMYDKYIRIKQILKSGEIGDLSRVMLVNSRYLRTSHYHNSAGWRSSWNGEGGGALINQGAHILDIWQWLFGMPEKIFADIPFGKYNDFFVDDEATIHMRYDNNMTAVFILTTGEAVWEERLDIIGTKGKLSLCDDELYIWKYSEDSLRYIRTAQVNSRENLDVIQSSEHFEKMGEPYAQMLDNFAEAVLRNDKDVLVSQGKDAVNQIMLTNAAYYSALKEQQITLPLDLDKYDEMYEKCCEYEREHLKQDCN